MNNSEEKELIIGFRLSCFFSGILLTKVITTVSLPFWGELFLLLVGGIVFGFVIVLAFSFLSSSIPGRFFKFLKLHAFIPYIIVFLLGLFLIYRQQITDFISNLIFD